MRPALKDLIAAILLGFGLQAAIIQAFGGGLSNIQLARSVPLKVLVLLLGPVFEEVSMRGFAY